MANDAYTTLNSGSGGDSMDESAVTYGSAPTVRKRPRVVIGDDAGNLVDLTIAKSFPVAIAEAIAAGANVIGKVGLDAANLAGIALDATVAAIRDRLPAALTSGGGVRVGVVDALPAGTNAIGKIDQGTGGASAWKTDGSAVTQPISAASLPLPGGASTEATLAARFGAVSLGAPVTVTSSGNTTAYTPTSGKRVRLTWVGAFRPDGDAGGTSITVTVKIGSTTIYSFPLSTPGAFAHAFRREGAVDETVVVNLSGAATILTNFDVQEF